MTGVKRSFGARTLYPSRGRVRSWLRLRRGRRSRTPANRNGSDGDPPATPGATVGGVAPWRPAAVRFEISNWKSPRPVFLERAQFLPAMEYPGNLSTISSFLYTTGSDRLIAW